MYCQRLMPLACLALLAACAGNPPAATGQKGAPTVAAATSQAEATAPVAVATPEGTPAPKPSEAVDTAASVSVTPPSPPAAATATPSPQPGLWRVEGYVIDETGNPLKNVCVVVGPHGCQKFSPHTDEQGHYFLDVAAATDVITSFDFYFETPGRETVWWHFTPTRVRPPRPDRSGGARTRADRRRPLQRAALGDTTGHRRRDTNGRAVCDSSTCSVDARRNGGTATGHVRRHRRVHTGEPAARAALEPDA